MDIKCQLPKTTCQKDKYMKCYNETKPLHLETDASRIGLSVTLLQTREGISCSRDEAPDNYKLRPIAVTSKSLLALERRHINRKRSISHTTRLSEVASLLFCQGGKYYNRTQTPGSYLQKVVATLSQQLQYILLLIHQYNAYYTNLDDICS